MSPWTKTSLRQFIKKKTAVLAPKDLVLAGEKIAHQVKKFLLNHEPPICNIALFASLPDEIDTSKLDNLVISLGLNRYFPRINQKNLNFVFVPEKTNFKQLLQKNFNIPEPAENLQKELNSSARNLSCFFIPGLAFDNHGNRLGRGLGYYDRYFAQNQFAIPPILIGTALDEQVVSQIPCEPHDIRVKYLLTPALGLKQVVRE